MEVLSASRSLEWPAPLKPYQVEGVEALLNRDRLLLADDMGLGKTVQAVAAMRILFHIGQLHAALLIVPAGLIDQWRRELARWAPELRVIPVRGLPHDRAWQWWADVEITLVGYETFRADSAAGLPPKVIGRIWDLVVLDEAQKIKNRDSVIAQSVKKLRRRRSWAMTGTPLENRLDDLASIMEFVDHCDGGERRHFAPGLALLQRHREIQLRRRKQDVLQDLPPKQIISVPITLQPAQMRAYARAEAEGIVQLRDRGAAVRIQHVLELILRLKQLCNRDPVSGESAKLQDVRERLYTLSEEGHRALLFSQFTDQSFGVGAAVKALSEFSPLSFTGGLSSLERDGVINRFRQDETHRVLVLSLRAGGVGLNLQEASYVFHLDRWWNPAVENQAEDRAHRLGQTYPVTVFRYTSLGTIEERIAEIIARKQRLFDDLVDDVSLSLTSQLSRDELFGLFGLEPPTLLGQNER